VVERRLSRIVASRRRILAALLTVTALGCVQPPPVQETGDPVTDLAELDASIMRSLDCPCAEPFRDFRDRDNWRSALGAAQAIKECKDLGGMPTFIPSQAYPVTYINGVLCTSRLGEELFSRSYPTKQSCLGQTTLMRIPMCSYTPEWPEGVLLTRTPQPR
jgi:hypothetical protein